MNFMSENCYQNLLNEIAFRIDGDLKTHLPKVQQMQLDINDLKKSATLVEALSTQVQQLGSGGGSGGGMSPDGKSKN